MCLYVSSPTYLIQHYIVGATERTASLLQYIANGINLQGRGDGDG